MSIRHFTICFASALLATGAIGTHANTYAITPAAASAQSDTPRMMPPYASLDNHRQVLLFISQAERLAANGDTTFAKMHINEALAATARLPAGKSAVSETDTDNSLHRITLLSVTDGTLERQLLLAQANAITEPLRFSMDDLPLQAGSITDAEVYYLTGQWNKAALTDALNKALRTIETGKHNAVIPVFGALHATLLETAEQTVPPRRLAQDNVALARALLKLGAYEAAQNALTRADEHIAIISGEPHLSPTQFSDIASIRNEMADIQRLITRREPDMLKTIDEQLKKWWNALS
jgi:tetratricopeptide (TPR) repeat protein